MLRLKPYQPHATILHIDGMEIFFSYETPVAAFIPGEGYLRTTQYFSKTTSRHLNSYLAGKDNVTLADQVTFHNILNKIGLKP